jgi:hypothetical protein
MNSDIEEMINKYFDEELTKNQEIMLFSILSQDGEAIDYFKKMNLLRNTAEKTKEEFPAALDEKILLSLSKKGNKKALIGGQRMLLFGSYALAVILLIISAFLFNSLNNYRQEVDNAVNEVKAKTQMIDFILNNTLPAAEVRAVNANEIIIKAN